MKIKKGKIIKTFAKTIIVLCILYNVIFLITTTISQKDYLKIFGISLLSMNSDLMKDDINQNDLVIVRTVKQDHLKIGDIIAYNVNGQIRINKILNDNDGYTTKSNKNYYPDIEKISYDQIIGKKVINISSLGNILEILHSKITSAVILVVFICYYLYNIYINRKKEERARKKRKVIN